MKRILIAEDEPITCLELVESLEELGCEVIGIAEDGFDAVELCRQHRPDVVLMDVRMPVFDGLSAAETILSEDIADCVILLTAFSDRDIISRAKQIGITAYLVKPVDTQRLMPAIEVAYAQSQRLKASREETRTAQKKNDEDRRIRKAQTVLAQTRKFSEEETFQWMRKTAMNKRISLAALADAILEQEDRSNPVTCVKRLLMKKYDESEDKAYRRIANQAKVNGKSMEETALMIKKQIEGEP